ncbi:MAG: ribonuclease P protein component [Bacteroidales bacterium]|nr:ribonuclease P protein component [Bacteroidales bacterium]
MSESQSTYCDWCGKEMQSLRSLTLPSGGNIAFDTRIFIQNQIANLQICDDCMLQLQNLPSVNKPFSLSKSEILSLEKLIGNLFSQGKSVTSYPIKIIYRIEILDASTSAQTLFTVPKRNFKRAVKRNRLRRRMKEAYRLNKSILYSFLSKNQLQLTMAIIYIGKEENSYAEIEQKIVVSLQKIIKNLSNSTYKNDSSNS